MLASGLAALALAGCGSTANNNSAVTVSGNTLTIYAAVPPGSPTAVETDVIDGERLALAQAGSKSGQFTLRLTVVHGATVSDDARAAISNKTTIAYLGEIEPGTSGTSVQITNQLGLLQISPIDTAIYLTQPTPAVPDSPNHWFPSHGNFGKTFQRMVPTSDKEAQAIASQLKTRQLTKLYVAHDSGSYGKSFADEIRQAAGADGVSVVSSAAAADAVFYAGEPGAAATGAVDQAVSANPSATVFVPSALYDPNWVAGLSRAAQRRLWVSAPGYLPGHYPAGGAAFVAAFVRAYHHTPAPQAAFGYTAMQALVTGLGKAGANADSRNAVTAEVQSLHDQQSPVGTYSLNAGDTNIAPFIFAHPVAGTLVPRLSG